MLDPDAQDDAAVSVIMYVFFPISTGPDAHAVMQIGINSSDFRILFPLSQFICSHRSSQL